MKKLLKYELKGTFKFILMVLLTIVLASSVAQVGIYRLTKIQVLEANQVSGPVFGAFLIGIAFLVIWASFLVSFFYIVNNFNKELLDDRGYLTFTLPLKGREILSSKVISALISFLFLTIMVILYNVILGSILVKMAGINIFEELLQIKLPQGVGKFILLSIVFGLISSIGTLITIYFSMTIRKVIFKGRKFNAMWFIIFLVLNGAIAVLGVKIMEYFPQFITITETGKFAVESLSIFSNGSQILFPPIFNISNMLLNIVIAIVLFIITSYLLDKKVEI